MAVPLWIRFTSDDPGRGLRTLLILESTEYRLTSERVFFLNSDIDVINIVMDTDSNKSSKLHSTLRSCGQSE